MQIIELFENGQFNVRLRTGMFPVKISGEKDGCRLKFFMASFVVSLTCTFCFHGDI